MKLKMECRKSIMIVAMFLTFSGVALAESTHEASTCGTDPHCLLTVIKSFVTAVKESSSGVNFSVSH